ncbi:hypothetical protein DTZ02_11945 [Escherichia coli]|nr:hypothetical protein [Escherichia coli]
MRNAREFFSFNGDHNFDSGYRGKNTEITLMIVDNSVRKKGIKRGFAGECSSQSFLCNFSIAACGELPIMRLHRHGGCESLHTNSRFG